MKRPKLIQVHIIPVAVVHGWLVSSRDKRWDWHDTQYFESKAAALAYAHELADWIPDGVSVRVHLRNGRLGPEFTLPRSKDPRRSKG